MNASNILTTVEIDTREVEALRIIVEFHMDDDDEDVREIHERLSRLLARAERALERA